MAKIWDTATGKTSVTLKGHTDGINVVAFSPDGKRIVTASADNTAKVWNAATGKLHLTFTGHTRVKEISGYPVCHNRVRQNPVHEIV